MLVLSGIGADCTVARFGKACTQDLTGQDLGGKTLTPGVFIFKTGSTLTTASSSSVVMTNGGTPCNVFWQVGSSATLGTATSFGGNILALAGP